MSGLGARFFRPDAETSDAPFNMAGLYYVRLNELLAARDRASIGQDLKHYYSCLEAIFNNVFFMIKKNEKNITNLEKQFKAVHTLLGSNPPKEVDKRIAEQIRNSNNWSAKKILGEIDRELMILMDRHKMIFPRMDTIGGLAGFRQAMQIDPPRTQNE